jgi:hypothetical protein
MSDLRETLEEVYASADTQSQEPQTVATDEDNKTAPAEPVEVITAPNSYKQEFKDSFNTLTPEWQKYLSAREKEVEQGLSRARNQYSWVDKAYNDRKDNLVSQGFNNAQEYFNTLVSIADSLDKDPQGTITQLQSIYGVGVADNPLQKQVQALSQQLAQQQGYLQAKENERVKNEYDAFINAKDEKGNLVHGYFEDVKGDMLKLLQAGLANNFEDAYNKAIWQVESVRNKIIAQQQNAEIAQKTAVAQKAKSASFDPTSKTEPAPKEYDLREELERNYDKLGE